MLGGALSQAPHAVQELQLVSKNGSHSPPSRDELTERICQAFAKMQEPDFSDLTGGDIFRYFVSLFDMEVFENDPVSAAWVRGVIARVSEISDK